MINKTRTVVWALLLFSGSTWAQVCPWGAYPGSLDEPQICMPPPAEEQSTSQVPQGRWETRWGAIATDGLNIAVGTVVGARSKRQALKSAMTQCRTKGGKACKAILSYYNQCAVVVTGDKQHLAQSAATIDQASQVAVSKCNAIDVNCRVYYAECSPPVWIQ